MMNPFLILKKKVFQEFKIVLNVGYLSNHPKHIDTYNLTYRHNFRQVPTKNIQWHYLCNFAQKKIMVKSDLSIGFSFKVIVLLKITNVVTE